MRKFIFTEGGYYHVYNRGVDKRSIFSEPEDLLRFLQSMKEFNIENPNGGIYANKFNKNKKLRNPVSKLVNFVAYCLNQNHFHFILTPLVDNGIQKFMHKLALGYTKFFNEKYDRSGSLFQGNYKATHIDTNEYLLHLSVYVNVNNKVHIDLNEEWLLLFPFSSLDEYQNERYNSNCFCDSSIVLDQFKSRDDYIIYLNKVLPIIIEKKKLVKSLKDLIID